MTTWAEASTTARTRVRSALVTAGVSSSRIALGEARLSPLPALSDTWARVTIREATSSAFAFGSPRTFEDVGLVSAELFVPAASGEGALRTLADAVRAAMPAATVSGVQFGPPRLVPVGIEDGFYKGLLLTDFVSFYTA